MSADGLEYSRNLGFISIEEQERLNESTVAIAGAGGDGGMLALQLARLGVGNFKIADPDPFEIENINRQATCTHQTLGINKATAVGQYISDINPQIKTEIFTDGVTETNVKEFCAGADLIIDETEFSLSSLGVMIARQARQQDTSVLMAMNIGFGATVTSFHPRGKTFESFLGLKTTDTLESIAAKPIDLSKWLAYVPPYADINTFAKVASGEKTAPSVAPGVAIAAGVASIQATLHLLNGINSRPNPIFAPKVVMVDGYDVRAKIIKHPRMSHYVYRAQMLGRNIFGRNPKASY